MQKVPAEVFINVSVNVKKKKRNLPPKCQIVNAHKSTE